MSDDNEPNYVEAMNLPDGKACGDCQHINRCKAMFGHIETDLTCDFYPNRFNEKPKV